MHMTVPPLTPPQLALKKVLFFARLNGRSVVIIATVGALISLLFGDLVGAIVGAMAAGAGFLELSGRRQLVRRDLSGMKRVERAELLLLGIIASYAVSRLASFDTGYVTEQLVPELRERLLAQGINLDELLQQFGLTVGETVRWARLTFYALYGGLLALTILFQGGMAFYYRRKSPLVAEELSLPPKSEN